MASKAKRRRAKQLRERGADPTLRRQTWTRKPQTQIVNNAKAEQRRSWCRDNRHQERRFLLGCVGVEDNGGFVTAANRWTMARCGMRRLAETTRDTTRSGVS